MGDSLPRMPINWHAKFDAASFILGGEICNHTKWQNYKQTNSNRYIHTLPISMCGNDNQRLKLFKNSVRPTSVTHINTNRPVAKGFLKTASQIPVDHFALIGLLFKLHEIW